MAEVELREVNAENVRDVCGLELAEGQERFVAHPAVTVAQSHYYEGAEIRAIYAANDLVGLAAFECEDGEWYLWRLIIDKAHQRKGHGSAALAQVIDIVRERGATEFLTSYVTGEGDPRDFYLKFGFQETDRVEEGERVLRLALSP